MSPILLSLISMGVQTGAGILGQLLGADDGSRAFQLRQEQLAAALGIQVPELQELVAKEQGTTNLGGIQTDGALDAYQDEAQGRLAEIGRAGGMDAQARARLAQTRMDGAQQERSQREAILSEARQRGTLGSGGETSALLQAQQGSADRAAMSDLQTLSDAERRAMQAILSSGQMAANRQSTQWNQRAQVATAQDEIDRFNTSTSNNFQLANAQQRQQQFQNRMNLTGMQNNAREGMARTYDERAQQTRDMVSGIGNSIGYGVGAFAQAMPAGGGAGGGVSPLGTSAAFQPLDQYLAKNRRGAR